MMVSFCIETRTHDSNPGKYGSSKQSRVIYGFEQQGFRA